MMIVPIGSMKGLSVFLEDSLKRQIKGLNSREMPVMSDELFETILRQRLLNVPLMIKNTTFEENVRCLTNSWF